MRFETELRKTASVLKQPRYALLGVVVAGLSFAIYALLLNLSLLSTLVEAGQYGLALTMVPRLISGFVMSTTILSLAMLAVTSLMIGLNVSLATFRLLELSSFGKEGAGSVAGMVVAVVAPACPACATTIFAFAGMTSVFAVLPFKGTELKVLAVLLLAGSAYYTARQIDSEVCELCQI
ncbi:MAG: hypothetical protein SV186_01550 [Candidatus Nanohaloarchaea archaeon]|nr:hypothetical protein [Candidatus Nanohaloarchaea archaeon]